MFFSGHVQCFENHLEAATALDVGDPPAGTTNLQPHLLLSAPQLHQGDLHATRSQSPAGLLASPTGDRPLRSPGPLRLPAGDREIDAGRSTPNVAWEIPRWRHGLPEIADIALLWDLLWFGMVFYCLLICMHDGTHDGEDSSLTLNTGLTAGGNQRYTTTDQRPMFDSLPQLKNPALVVEPEEEVIH